MINFATSMLALVLTYALARIIIHIAKQASVIKYDNDADSAWREMNNGAYKYELDRCCAFSHWLLTYDHDPNMIHRIMDAYDYHKDHMDYHYKHSLGIERSLPQTPYHKTGSSFDDMFKDTPECKSNRPLMYDEDDDLPF